MSFEGVAGSTCRCQVSGEKRRRRGVVSHPKAIHAARAHVPRLRDGVWPAAISAEPQRLRSVKTAKCPP
jgi:hypothetical protein